MSVGLDRMMVLYLYDGQTSSQPTGERGCRLAYTFTTGVVEQQLADDIAQAKGYRQGDGHWAVLEPGSEECIKKLDFPL